MLCCICVALGVCPLERGNSNAQTEDCDTLLLLQATQDELPSEGQRQLAQSHLRMNATVAAVRQTLHDEHSCLVQVPASQPNGCHQ
jgi:hypothetical protein